MPKPAPQLPLGTSSTLRGLSETFSFHSSPESFITSRILDFQKQHPEIVESRAVVRAKVLNRNVAVLTSHAQIKQVLHDDCAHYEACAAYDELMAPFFPSPNLLLTDGAPHGDMRGPWHERMGTMGEKMSSSVERLTREHFASIPSGSEVDLYEVMKTLSWKLLLGIFLDLHPDEAGFGDIESLQEDLLRGQFSLFPVSISTGFWSSPRKRGIEANKKLQVLILERLKSQKSACPFAAVDENALQDVANHILLMTSSLAVKALASLLTAFCLNLFLFKDSDSKTPAERLGSEENMQRRSESLRSILFETERLSPPIVGIMRRSTRENVIASAGEQSDVLVPKGWDCWLYFVGGGRDPTAYGSTWDRFVPDRYTDPSTPEAMAFGGGPKTCLGRDTVRQIASTVAGTWIDLSLQFKGEITAQGVRGWLGWEPNDSVRTEDWAADMKQLPTQHPTRPIMLQLLRQPQQ